MNHIKTKAQFLNKGPWPVLLHSPWSPPRRYTEWCPSGSSVSAAKCWANVCPSCRCAGQHHGRGGQRCFAARAEEARRSAHEDWAKRDAQSRAGSSVSTAGGGETWPAGFWNRCTRVVFVKMCGFRADSSQASGSGRETKVACQVSP